MKTKKQLAAEAHNSGYNCAQSVLVAFCGDYGIEKETALKLAGGMGGGFRSGEICGAASGGVMVVGLKYGQFKDGDADSKKLCGAKTKEFIRAFKDKSGSVVTCRDILKVDTSTDEGQAQIKGNNLYRKICDGTIDSAVEILEELGY